MTRIFRYILMHDSGMAPCIDNGMVSLATCKPKIRASAEPGDWIIGCWPRPAPRGLVIWAGRVAAHVEAGEYECQYRGRADAIYRGAPGAYERLRADYHPGDNEFRKDTSAPVLVFDRDATWYFGRKPQQLPEHLMHLAAGGRGHRVKGVKTGDSDALHAWLKSIVAVGIHAEPSQRSPSRC